MMFEAWGIISLVRSYKSKNKIFEDSRMRGINKISKDEKQLDTWLDTTLTFNCSMHFMVWKAPNSKK